MTYYFFFKFLFLVTANRFQLSNVSPNYITLNCRVGPNENCVCFKTHRFKNLSCSAEVSVYIAPFSFQGRSRVFPSFRNLLHRHSLSRSPQRWRLQAKLSIFPANGSPVRMSEPKMVTAVPVFMFIRKILSFLVCVSAFRLFICFVNLQ